MISRYLWGSNPHISTRGKTFEKVVKTAFSKVFLLFFYSFI
nr:MAG TPA: THIOREDOXIN-LIKE PROTEIN 4A, POLYGLUTAMINE-BINDING PROTEIN, NEURODEGENERATIVE DISORDERS.1A [Caudoviricetes sp.]